MDVKKYIASGILELYVAGTLSEQENQEVHENSIRYPEIKEEIEAIEATILGLTKSISPGLSKSSFSAVAQQTASKVVPIKQRKSITPYIGWAASLLFAAGMVWMYVQNNKLDNNVKIATEERQNLEEQIRALRTTLASKEEKERLLNVLRDQDIEVIALGGQSAAPTSYAKAYWNKQERKVYIDAKGLPEPPKGFDYQVWSLTLNPLTPTSIGVLENFSASEERIFELQNTNGSEAFGITLEPEGGSEAPNLEQLYTLGAVGP